jgi:hypothetical protein
MSLYAQQVTGEQTRWNKPEHTAMIEHCIYSLTQKTSAKEYV